LPAGAAHHVTSQTEQKLARDDHHLWTSERGMSVLLVLLVFSVFVVPVIFPLGGFGLFVGDASVTLILMSGIFATTQKKPVARVLTALAVIAIAVRWLPWAVPGADLPVLREASSLATMLLLATVVAMKVFAPGHVTGDRVMGAVTLYLLLGLSWAMMYEILALADSGAFAGISPHGSGHQRWVYFSFVTLTTVGYGDITPASTAARSLAILEALVGQLYPAVLLGRLVSLQTQAPGEPRD
jgi:hypothetical protein